MDVIVSVGNNFFYTKSLPCSLWFFDKGKREELQDKVLFLDARNYYTVVDRTLNEWSEWQLKNLNAIVWLYRGETDKYQTLLSQYYRTLRNSALEAIECAKDLSAMLPERFHAEAHAACGAVRRAAEHLTVQAHEELSGALDALRYANNSAEGAAIRFADSLDKESRKALADCFGFKTYKEYEKRLEILAALASQSVATVLSVIKELSWLYEKFGEGEYLDIPGLCKVASRAEIEEKNYSLTPGAYVGVAAAEDDGVDFAQRMAEIHRELLSLQAESNALMDTISKNMKERGL